MFGDNRPDETVVAMVCLVDVKTDDVTAPRGFNMALFELPGTLVRTNWVEGVPWPWISGMLPEVWETRINRICWFNDDWFKSELVEWLCDSSEFDDDCFKII